MRFHELINGLDLVNTRGDLETEISDIDCDSREINQGMGFVALKGAASDGHDYIRQAIDNGAAAVLSERELPGAGARASALFNAGTGANPREVMALLAQRVNGSPDRSLPLIAVTGTNGKTTTTMLIRQLLLASGMGCGLIGTVMNAAGSVEAEAVRTSPESTTFYRWVKKSLFAEDACMAVEVSSHAMDLARVYGAKFKVGVFTNLTQDHLDFHENMEAYFRAKAKLFSQCDIGLVNAEDGYGRRLLSENPDLISYGLDSGAYRSKNLILRHDGTSFTLQTPRGRFHINSPLLGRFNAYNLLAALSALDAAGFDLEKLLPNTSALKGAPGRLERVDLGQPFGVMVDYAHTPDALEKLLSAGKDLLTPGGRLHVLFGCGGDRDRTKRPIMAQAIVSGGADVIWHTSDNTRTEDPERMLNDAAIGIPEEIRANPGRYRRIADRALAVHAAIADCRPGDLLLLAGKGHEPYQDVMGVKHPYSDRAAVEAALRGEEISRPWASGPKTQVDSC
ncbi:MAG: UDP-N-acetylmuramoyl-L-alanyl-D-glutamate--2,6-diaminopimelate ligase [Holophagales bacterium]|jgi:UDP-N-acetylmuramoyl-L-alanyl-D-glutamate--2,6-diaminopimelate ligase|nr:UDP-N-acetylmuramoyl-L-alanyl-D-glutamate--2,6-diaminopimelate ligase [Holophagales bacterium]